MFNRICAIFTLALALQFAAPAAIAQQADAVSLTGDVKVVRQIEENGTTISMLEDPVQVVPGDTVVFRTNYQNVSAEMVEDFVITNPLPAAVVLAEPGDFMVSIDRGSTFAPLAGLSVTLEDGSSRAAELADVTHIRWMLLRLAPGESGTVTYFAVIR